MAETLYDFFSRISLFKGFDESDLNVMIRVCNRAKFLPFDVICREGDAGDSMYIIREGVVQVQRWPKRGKPIVLARLSEGMVVGEMSLIDDSPRSATLAAETDVLLYEIRRSDFDMLKDDFDPAAYKLLRAIGEICCQRIRDVNGQVQAFIENPRELFTPEIKTEAAPALAERVKGLIRLFGKRA